MYNEFKNFGKIVNSYRPVITNSGISFFLNRYNRCLLPHVWKSIMRKAEIKDNPENRYNNFSAALHDKTWYSIESD
jgi:nitrogen regulatory protein PII-like uncharacterized protein